MKDNEIIINDKSSVKRTYLQAATIGRTLPVLMFAAVLVCAALWFFFGQMTVSVTGYCESSENKTVFVLPMNYGSRIVPGDVIWAGNCAGKVESLYKDSYFTYEDIRNSDDIVLQNFLNSGKCDETIAYVLGSAGFLENIAGMTEYRIVIDKVTPYRMLTGGKQHER